MLVVGLAEKMWFLSGWIPGSTGAGTWWGPQGGCTGSNWSVCGREGLGSRDTVEDTSHVPLSMWLNDGHHSLVCNDRK